MTLFDDADLVARKATRLAALPPMPFTGWRAPTEFPNLSGAAMVAFDTETKDPELIQAGPGWARHRGHIVGISLAVCDRLGNYGKWYFPMRHEVCPEENLNPDNVLGFCKHVLENTVTPKVGANLLYDVGWLSEEGIYVQGPLHDVQFAEAILDNNARVALDTLAKKYLGEHKNSDTLERWITEAYKPKKGKWRGDIWRSPPSLVGPYGEDDADLPLRVIQKQWPLLDAENLGTVYRMECDLVPMLVQMRHEGVSVDVEEAQRLLLELRTEIDAMYDNIETKYGYRLTGSDGDPSSHSNQIGKLLTKIGVSFPRTAAGNPSIEKEWLDTLDHPVGEEIHNLREHEKICGTFIQAYILDKNVNGKLYPQFHPLKGDTNGTMLGRFASSDPNLQNIPSRTELGKRVRRLFKPDYGHFGWAKYDYSQIHYRILAHNAVDKGDGSAEALRQRYINDPDIDYHMDVYKNVAPLMGWNTDYTLDAQGKVNKAIQVKRRITKNVNFSLLYGVGEKSLRYKYLGDMTEAEIKRFFEAYYVGAPYVKPTMDAISKEAETFGYVTTLKGRRIRFELWEPRGYGKSKGYPMKYDDAVRNYGTFIQLAYLYRAVNYKFQGSEPDIMKTGMLDCWRSGVFDYTGLPRLTVHDELDFSVRDDTPAMRDAFRFIQHTMQQAITLRVPVKVDASRGANWGDAD